MFKKFLTSLFLVLFINFFFINSSFAESEILSEDNVLIKAFEERKKRLFDVINWWELTQEINKLKIEINSLNNWEELNEEIKAKLIADIDELTFKLEELVKQDIQSEEVKSIINEAEQSIKIKNNLVDSLNEEIEENNLNKEKVNLLLKQNSQLKIENDIKEQDETMQKYYIFFWFTVFLFFIYLLLNYLSKIDRINKKRIIYSNFFLIFWYIIFLIWFFFYLHPELSIFIIFISGYLLAINAHLIASFVWSIFILEKYKIWDIIKFWEYKWQIIKITTINTVLLPITNEWIFSNKPIVIPNVDLLKNTVIKDNNPEAYIHDYELKFAADLWIDVIQLVESIENNILLKHLNNRLNTLAWNEESFRTSIWFDRFWRILITFTRRWDDVLNKRIERKIMWMITKTIKIHVELKEKWKEKELWKDCKKIKHKNKDHDRDFSKENN